MEERGSGTVGSASQGCGCGGSGARWTLPGQADRHGRPSSAAGLEGGPGLRADDAVRGQASAGLVVLDGLLGTAAEDAIDGDGAAKRGCQRPLQPAHVRTAGAVLQ